MKLFFPLTLSFLIESGSRKGKVVKFTREAPGISQVEELVFYCDGVTNVTEASQFSINLISAEKTTIHTYDHDERVDTGRNKRSERSLVRTHTYTHTPKFLKKLRHEKRTTVVGLGGAITRSVIYLPHVSITFVNCSGPQLILTGSAERSYTYCLSQVQ